MTLDLARTGATSPARRARLGAAVLLASTAVLTGCGAGGPGSASSSPAAATTSASSNGAASSGGAGASGSAPDSAPSSSSGAPALPAGVDADVELPENEKVLALKEPMAEILGILGDVTVDTTPTGEFSILRSQQQEYATATDPEAEEMRAGVRPLADDECWAAQGAVHGLLAESGGTEVSYSGARVEPAEGGEAAGPDASVLIITLPDEAAAEQVEQAERNRETSCVGNADDEAALATERVTVDGVEYDVATTTATGEATGTMPGTTVTTRDGARLIAVTTLESGGVTAAPEQVLDMAQAVRAAVAEEFGPAS